MNDFSAVVSSSGGHVEIFHTMPFFMYRHLILIISYSTCVIIVCLRKLQDVVETIRTNILLVFNEKWKSRRFMKRRNFKYNKKILFFYSFVSVKCGEILNCCRLTLAVVKSRWKNTTYLPDNYGLLMKCFVHERCRTYTYIHMTMHFEASCLRDQHFLNNARARYFM